MGTKLRLCLAAVLAALLINVPVFAQEGSVHGAAISALDGGGCINLTGTNPPSYPGVPGKIPCSKAFTNEITFQGTPASATSFIGTATSVVNKSSFLDGLGLTYNVDKIDSRIDYGTGNDNYAEFASDGANRARRYNFTVPNLVNALNGNPDFKSAVAEQLVVNGTALGFEVAGGKQLLEAAENVQQSFEIYPRDPHNFNSLTNPNNNPYTISWVTPSKSATPHMVNQPGVSFRSIFDSDVGQWRYFIDVDGPTINVIGKYVIYLQIAENAPRTVTYNSSVQGILTWKIARVTKATLTLSYGVDQCINQAGVTLPSMLPLLELQSKAIALAKKDFKKAKKNLVGTVTTGNAVRAQIPKMRRRLTQALIKNAEARAQDAQAVSTNLGDLSAVEQTTLILRMGDLGRTTTLGGKNGSEHSIRKLARSVSKLFPRAPRSGGKQLRQGATRTGKQYKAMIKAADNLLESYLLGLISAQDRLLELRENAAQCSVL